MVTLLVPVDIEQVLIDELSPNYAIASSLPAAIPAVFLRVIAAGGVQRDLVTDTFTVTLEAFAATETAARDALMLAVAHLQSTQQLTGQLGGHPCGRLQIASLPQNLPFPTVLTHKRYITTLVPDLRRQSISL